MRVCECGHREENHNKRYKNICIVATWSVAARKEAKVKKQSPSGYCYCNDFKEGFESMIREVCRDVSSSK